MMFWRTRTASCTAPAAGEMRVKYMYMYSDRCEMYTACIPCIMWIIVHSGCCVVIRVASDHVVCMHMNARRFWLSRLHAAFLSISVALQPDPYLHRMENRTPFFNITILDVDAVQWQKSNILITLWQCTSGNAEGPP